MSQLTLSDLVDALQRLAAAAPGPKTQNPRSSLAKVADYFAGHGEKTLDEFVREIEAAQSTKVNATVPRAKGPKRPKKPVDQGVVEQYVDRLRSALYLSVDDFEAVMTAVAADKKVRADELERILVEYTGDETKGLKKAQMTGRIREIFNQRFKDSLR